MLSELHTDTLFSLVIHAHVETTDG